MLLIPLRAATLPNTSPERRGTGVVADVRDDRLRLGFGLYHRPEDIDELCRQLMDFPAPGAGLTGDGAFATEESDAAG